MDNIALRQVHHGGITIQVPEIWEVETETYDEPGGQKSYTIDIEAQGNDIRSINISYGPMPEDSDAYAEACGTYEEVMDTEELDASDEPIMCFGFKEGKAYGFNLHTEEGLPCFFFCTDVKSGKETSLLTVLVCAPDNDEMQSLIDFVEEYLDLH